MAQYSSYFRNNIRRERIADTTFTRTITISLSSYGTVSASNYEANGDLVKRAYSDIINRIYDPNVIVELNIPAGDYYFRGTSDVNQYIIFEPPQGGQVKIVGADVIGSRPTSDALKSQSKVNTYTSLAAHYPTRFHFSYNGIYFKSKFGGTPEVGGFTNIAFFGSWNGSPGTQVTTPSVDSRGIAGNLRLESCAIHGFNGPTANSCGIIADGTTISHYSLIVSNCGRGIQSNGNGSCTSYNSSNDIDIIVNCNYQGLLAFENSTIRLSDGAHIKNTTLYGAYAFDCSSIIIKNPTFELNSQGQTYVEPNTNSVIHTSTAY